MDEYGGNKQSKKWLKKMGAIKKLGKNVTEKWTEI